VELSKVFETYTLYRSEFIDRRAMYAEIKSLVEKSEIKIVDIKRDKDHLTIVFRRLR
jgi:hypothetical protein